MKTKIIGRLLLPRLLLLSFQEREKRGIADCFKGLFEFLTPQILQIQRDRSRGRMLFCVCIMDVTSNSSNLFNNLLKSVTNFRILALFKFWSLVIMTICSRLR